MTLTMYLLGALASWMPPHSAEMQDRQASVASDIASVVESPTEPPLKDEGVVGTGLLLASLAVMEGGLAKHVDGGLCNDPKWRAAHRPMLKAGDCDGGKAFSLWQIHVGSGLVLLPLGGYVSLPYAGPSMGIEVKSADLIASRPTAIRTALHMLRQSFSDGRGMCGYTGESGECPKGKARLQKARDYAKRHPMQTES